MKRTGPETQHLQTARLPSEDGFEEGLIHHARLAQSLCTESADV